MKSFQKKGKIAQIIQSKFFLIFFGILLLFFIYNLFSFITKMQETNRNKNILENKISELEKSKEKLNTDINKLNTDQGIEENIRDKFGLAKEGENMILIVDDKNTIKTDIKDNSKNIFTIIKNWFK